MDLSPPMAMEKSDIQESAAFEQVTVYLTEDILLDFDPYLFALSGNNLQQYCTLLSWLEMRKHNSELYLETEEGVATPLLLVHIEEEFNTSPSLYQYQGDGAAHIKEQGNIASLARLQYNFVQEANQPTRSSEFFLTGENVSLFPEQPKPHPHARWGADIKDVSTASAPQGDSLHVKTTYVSLKQDGSGVALLSREQNNPQHAVVAGDSSRKEGHPSERSPPEKESHPGNNIKAVVVNQLSTSEVHEGTCDREVFSGGPNSAEKHLCSIPLSHPQVFLKGNHAFRCSKCSHLFESSSASLVGQVVQAANNWVKPASSFTEKAGEVAEKPFHCPDCGKGFLHQSSIPRHRRLHQRENSSPDSEKQMPNPCADGGASFAMKPFVVKRQRIPGIDQLFKCPLCEKSYGQKYHLRRHQQMKHQVA